MTEAQRIARRIVDEAMAEVGKTHPDVRRDLEVRLLERRLQSMEATSTAFETLGRTVRQVFEIYAEAGRALNRGLHPEREVT